MKLINIIVHPIILNPQVEQGAKPPVYSQEVQQ